MSKKKGGKSSMVLRGSTREAITDWKSYEKGTLRPIGKWFSRAFSKPHTPTPDNNTSAADIARAASEAAMATAKEKEKSRLRASAGRRSLIATSGAGVLEPATTNKKKLTGE